jgi:hypothetical protein
MGYVRRRALRPLACSEKVGLGAGHYARREHSMAQNRSSEFVAAPGRVTETRVFERSDVGDPAPFPTPKLWPLSKPKLWPLPKPKLWPFPQLIVWPKPKWWPFAWPMFALPPGASRQKLAVPAFWGLTSEYDDDWNGLISAGSAVAAVVIDGSWPTAAAGNPTFKSNAINRLDQLPGAVLGYVSTRGAPPTFTLQNPDDIIGNTGSKGDSVKAWYDQFAGHIDGIYFDELVIPDVPTAVSEAQALVAKFRQVHPSGAADGKLMILAGQCIDSSVVGAEIDWAILWEGRLEEDPVLGPSGARRPYWDNFVGMRPDSQPTDPPPWKTAVDYIPSWWKDPVHRGKIVHVVHNCSEPNRQRALTLANERNAGNVFVMDTRGSDPTKPATTHALYDHLPPYWQYEIFEVNSYDDFGFDPLRVLRAAGRWGAKQPNTLHAFPNFEAAWYGAVHVRGTFTIASGVPGVTRQSLALSALPPVPPVYPTTAPPLHDIPAVWQAAHLYAKSQGKETAIPVFEPDPNFAVILFDQQSWLAQTKVKKTDTYEQPTFAEPGFVVRNVNRVTGKPTICTFVPDTTAAQGIKDNYDCYTLGQHIVWQDVPTSQYIVQL